MSAEEVPMTKASAHSFSRLSLFSGLPRLRAVLVLLAAAALTGGIATAVPAVAAVAAAPPYTCSPNGPAGNQTVYGTFGDASVIGWAGNSQGVVACRGSWW
jgi:hypothetical protein